VTASLKRHGHTPICYICGVEAASTKDHVVPDSLFPDGLRINLWTVPACRTCNASLAADEELFSVFVAGQSYGNPAGKQVWQEEVRRTLAKQPRLRRMLASQLQPVELRTKAGLWAGSAYRLPVRIERVIPVIQKIVRGLYYRERRKPLGSTEFDVHFNPEEVQIDLLKRARRLALNPPVFRCAWVESIEDDRCRIWWLTFFDSVIFICSTWPTDREKLPNQAASEPNTVSP
jgi:hypothetical protein